MCAHLILSKYQKLIQQFGGDNVQLGERLGVRTYALEKTSEGSAVSSEGITGFTRQNYRGYALHAPIKKEKVMNKKFWVTLSVTLFLVACWGFPAAADSLKVKAWIDGQSQLIIQGKTAPPQGQLLGLLEGMIGSQAYALNAKGQATGESWDKGYLSTRAFIWDPKTKSMRDLGTPAEWTHSFGESINSKGQVAGGLKKPGLTHLFIWDPVTGMQDLTNLGGVDAWVAWHTGINDKGQLCGASQIPDGSWRAFVWDPKDPGLQDLGTLPGGKESKAIAINSKGQVVGTADTSGEDRAFLWDPKDPGLQDLGTLPGGKESKAFAINSKGQVVGTADTGGEPHVFLWDPKNPGLQDLGTLPGATEINYSYINKKGKIVGTAVIDGNKHAFMWDPKKPGLQDLGTLGGTWSSAFSLNSKGSICGFSTTDNDTEQHGFIWDVKNKVMVDLGPFFGGTESGANDLNNKNQVAGYATDADGNQQAVIWTP
jgi:probable HAF family extracellular repeat protein